MDSDLPLARPRRANPSARANSIIETQPQTRRVPRPVCALLAVGSMALAAAMLWALIGMAAWRVFH